MFTQMKNYLNSRGEDCKEKFGYSDPYLLYVNSLYTQSVNELMEEMEQEISIQASPTQNTDSGKISGEVTMVRGDSFETSWSLDDECKHLEKFALEANNEYQFKSSIKDYLKDKFNQCK